jgi:adenosylcobinamide-GDP ribazoletransferase
MILTGIILTRGLHLDGFADMIDGFGVIGDKERRLKVIKDSRIGAMGGVGIVLLVLTKFVSLTKLVKGREEVYVIWSILLVYMFSRWGMVLCMGIGRWAKEKGMSKIFEGIKRKTIIISGIVPMVGGIIFYKGWGVGLFFLVIGVIKLLHYLSNKKLGGITGDVVGGGSELIEVIGFLYLIGVPLGTIG